ncbi:glycosyltransferase family 39 protein [uncultured Methanobacterium sp.]|uniref:ArnT family glycosyltransferase n=1 Tax=uncultured Methanobacterium sp. TaxID=176306 RepID=UPI002AA8933E|nr:glycosyltransferase family 39 protein [uncultured Methanobacterium sp.]
MRVKNFLIQNKEILILLLIYVVLYSFNLDKFPIVTGDENWFINPAYDLVMFGKMGTSMIYGFYNIANFTYWQPPVFILLLAAFFKLFGFGIVQARMVSVFLGFLTVLFTYLLGLKLYNKKIGLLAALLMLLNPLFFVISRTVRMDIAVACFMVIAIYCTFLALKESKLGYYFASALFATLALLSHPNGIIAILSVVIIILFEKIDFKSINRLKFNISFNEIFVFIAGVIIPLIPYILYISLDFEAFKGQFMVNIVASPSNPLTNIILEPTRYIELFWGLANYGGFVLTGVVFAITIILTILGLYYITHKLNFNDKFLLIVLVVSLGVLSVLVYHKYFIYLGLLLPYLFILIALTLKDNVRLQFNKKGAMSVFIIVLWVILIVGNCILINNFLEENKDYDYYSNEHEIEKYIPAGSVVMGNHNYWIALHDKYTYYGYEIRFGEGFHQYKTKINDMLINLKPEYILFDESVWSSEEDKSMEDFVNQNCTLIAVVPANDIKEHRIIKIYQINKPFS